MIGFVVGLVSGAAQFWMLLKFTQAVTGGTLSVKTALFGAFQFLVPLAVLFGCALLIRDDLLWAGVGMSCSLLGSAVTRFIMKRLS